MPKHALVRAAESTKRGKSAAIVKTPAKNSPAKAVTLSIAGIGKRTWEAVKRAATSTAAGAKARRDQKQAIELLAELLKRDPRELAFALDIAADLVREPAMKRFLREACAAATKKPKKKRVVSRPAPGPV